LLGRQGGYEDEAGQDEWPERAEGVHVGLDVLAQVGFQSPAMWPDIFTDANSLALATIESFTPTSFLLTV
jgi:hypothetical protein